MHHLEFYHSMRLCLSGRCTSASCLLCHSNHIRWGQYLDHIFCQAMGLVRLADLRDIDQVGENDVFQDCECSLIVLIYAVANLGKCGAFLKFVFFLISPGGFEGRYDSFGGNFAFAGTM